MGEESYTIHNAMVQEVREVNSPEYDALVVVMTPGIPMLQAIEDFVDAHRAFDRNIDKECMVVKCQRVCGNRLIISPTGQLTPYDDVRSIYEAALAGIRRAVKSGASKPALAVQPHPTWPRAELVAILGALEALYVDLQVREQDPSPQPVRALGVYGEGARAPVPALIADALALERARSAARDVGGADPERMTPLAAAAYMRSLFAGAPVVVRVLDDSAEIRRRYPLLAAVSRAADNLPKYKGCVIHLEYEPDEYEQTVMLVGKGVTYDTGGYDIKTGGCMAGMSRDKCGAAAAMGFLKACIEKKAPLKVVCALGMVRNCVAVDAYVSDERVKSRGGLYVRVGNTDAEGRMVMADLLHEMRERATRERNPHVYTVATLTGHAARAVGVGYSIAMDNHVARVSDHASKLAAAGETLADMIEVSRLRREDLAAHRGRAPGDAIHQAASLPSTAVPRGHQGPGGFLLLASGLNTGDVPYTHLDVAGSAGDFPNSPTGAPLMALASIYGLITSC